MRRRGRRGDEREKGLEGRGIEEIDLKEVACENEIQMILTVKIEVDAREGKMKIRQKEFLHELEPKFQSQLESEREDGVVSDSYFDVPERYDSK